jgi:hypothetical protein
LARIGAREPQSCSTPSGDGARHLQSESGATKRDEVAPSSAPSGRPLIGIA